MKVKSESEVAQSRPTLSDPMDCSLPGSSAHRIFQARVLEWGAIAFSDKIVQVTSIPKEKTKPKHNWNLTNSFHIKNSLGLPCEESGWRVCLSMQETRVQSLIQEDPTCHGAAGPLHHNYWACALKPRSHNYWSLCAARKTITMRSPCTTTKSSPCSLQLKKACEQQWRPTTAVRVKILKYTKQQEGK